ncbi:hypothetical protein M3J09_010838 [Ascochyta lentis]
MLSRRHQSDAGGAIGRTLDHLSISASEYVLYKDGSHRENTYNPWRRDLPSLSTQGSPTSNYSTQVLTNGPSIFTEKRSLFNSEKE